MSYILKHIFCSTNKQTDCWECLSLVISNNKIYCERAYKLGFYVFWLAVCLPDHMIFSFSSNRSFFFLWINKKTQCITLFLLYFITVNSDCASKKGKEKITVLKTAVCDDYISGHCHTEERRVQVGGKPQSQTNKVQTCCDQERFAIN